MPHYTSTDQDAFVERITFDFIGQIAQRLESSEMSQGQLAQKLGVTDSDVSQVLNLNRMNLNLKTMVRYARALGMKLAIVAYDDGDPNNQNGPVGSEIFGLAWEKIGQPRNILMLNGNVPCFASSQGSMNQLIGWGQNGFTNFTGFFNLSPTYTRNTNEQMMPPFIPEMLEEKKASTRNA